MNKKQFQIWLIENDMNAEKLASKLGITSRTIANYKAADRFPKWFPLALNTLQNKEC